MRPLAEEAIAVLAHLMAAWTAALYLVVGVALWQRRVDTEVRGPMRGFALWWLGLGAVMLAALLPEVGLGPARFGIGALRLFVYAIFVTLYVALVGLLHYLVFVYTGRRGLVRTAALVYAAHFMLLVWMFESQSPSIVVGEAGPDLVFRDPLPPAHPLALLFYLGILVPPIGGVLAYFLLFFQVDDRTMRYRIGMVSGGLLLWFVTNVYAALDRGFLGLPHQDPWVRLGAEGIGFLAALIVLLGFFPPRILARRLGLRLASEIPAHEAN